MCRYSVFLFVALLSVVDVFAKSDLTDWQKAKLIATYPLAIHQLPLTTVHEGSHWLVVRAYGDRASIHLLPSYMKNKDGSKALVFGYIEQKKELSPAGESLMLIAPYLVQLLVVDRSVELAYGRGHIRIDSFGDKYIQNAMLFNAFSPLENTLFSKHGDFGELARHTHIPRIILGAAVQAAYMVSYKRIMKARGHENSTWAFYIHKTF